ncbi:hypothetical protein ACFVMC_32190 [Nocardia sp. NPDC127579]|uniref:hypothetical protein n=1 Tax=Nocardia sp. NPDC127579 TaxID=3345402 RepID=UPI0036301A7C
MGVYCERIVDLEATAADAPRLATRIIDWLVAEHILTRELSRDRMYSDYAAEGYVPGPNWQAITGADWGNGPVAIALGRNIFVEGQGSDTPAHATCPACRTDTVVIDYPGGSWEPDREIWAPFAAALSTWRTTGAATATCPTCTAATSVTDWRWSSDFTLSCLAFEFWNWPPLTDAFHQELAARLGHPLRRQVVKL